MRKLFTLLAMVAALPAGAQQAPNLGASSASDSGAAAYGNNITFNSSAPEVQRVEGTQKIETSGETEQYISYGGTHRIKSAPQAYAPPVGVTAPCVIGVSAGISGMGWGFGGGTGYNDVGCERRAVSALMHAWGHVEAAKEVLCVDPTVAAAYARVGMPCKAASQKPVAVPVSSPTGKSGTIPACYNDYIVAKRMGMPTCSPD